MASPALFRSAAGRLLSRSSVPSTRSPRVFLSGVAGRIEPCKFPCSYSNRTEGGRICRFDEVLDELQDTLRATQKLINDMQEEEKRLQWHLRLQKKLACVLVPTAAAVWIFAPDKKGKSSAEEQASP